jgi:hypothetical protein
MNGAVRESNPRPLAPEARIIPLDQRPLTDAQGRDTHGKSVKLNPGWRFKGGWDGGKVNGETQSGETPHLYPTGQHWTPVA